QVSARGFSQGDMKISLNLTEVKLNKALTIIEKKSGYRIFYSDDDLPASTIVSIKATMRLSAGTNSRKNILTDCY
ncbi:hypothetical protein, partial [Flavitalea sp.]|nr:hypothetical protein [Flavitalea sp.]